MTKWKLVDIERAAQSTGKKWVAKFESTNASKKTMKRVRFGALGAEDYTIHKDSQRRKRYLERHRKDLLTRDPTRPGYLSYYLLWGPTTSLRKNLEMYRQKFSL